MTDAMKNEGVRRLYNGDYNNASITINDDGTQTIELSKIGENIIFKMRIKNPFKDDETVLEYKEETITAPAHIVERFKEARKK